MKELKKDLFEAINDGADAICITTNGQYSNGKAWMGGGCARVCAERWPETSINLANKLKTFMENVPFVIGALDDNSEYIEPTLLVIKSKKFKSLIISFPTIDNLMDGSKLHLIEKSTIALVKLTDRLDLKNIFIGRPGVGIGGLSWKDVKCVIKPLLDERFTIVSFDHEE